MSEMIDRVAAAMFKASGATVIASIEPAWLVYVPQARAAIEAMRTPTKEMIEAAWASALAENAADVWEDMIDAALRT